MPLTKATLANALTDVFEARPSVAPEAAFQWADAYLQYAHGAIATAGGMAVNAQAGLPVLLGAFTAGLSALQAQAAAAIVAQGVTTFWQMLIWVGPAAAGSTLVPGNFTLAPALGAIFASVAEESARDKAARFADAFDANARMVIVSEIPFVQPAPPIIGPVQ
jgi:hypothetical protein